MPSSLEVHKRVFPIVVAQICISAAVGLNLTVSAIAAAQLSGRDELGGWAQTSTVIGATTITFLTTKLSHKRQRLSALRFAILLAVSGSLMCSAAVVVGRGALWLLFAGFIFLGGGTVSALLSRFVASEKVGQEGDTASAIGAVLFGSAVGSAIGPNLYGLLSSTSSNPLRWTFITSAGVFALALVALLVEDAGSYLPSPDSEQGTHTATPFEWKPEFIWIFVVGIFAHASMICLMTMAPIYTDRVFGPAASGIIMTAHLLGMYALSPLVSVGLKWWGSRILLVVGVGIVVISTSALAFLTSSVVVFAVGLFGIGLTWSIGMVISSFWASQVQSPSQRISLQGRLDIAINIAAGVSSIVSGLVVSAFGYPALAAGLLVIALAAAVVGAVSTRSHPLPTSA